MSKPSTMRHNSTDSRDRLLKAAGELFSERGYDRTTVREIGQRAGVDAAMIARYFGGKPALYLASLRKDNTPTCNDPIDLRSAEAIQRLLDRVGSQGPTPTLYAAVRPHDDADLQSAAIEVLNRRMVEPGALHAHAAGLDDAQLRAEIVTAALAGIVLSRTSGAFSTLAMAASPVVGEIVAQLLSSLLERDEPA